MISILVLSVLSQSASASPVPPRPKPGEGVVLTQEVAPAASGHRFFRRLRESKSDVPPPPSASPKPKEAPADPPVRRVQGTPGDLAAPLTPDANDAAMPSIPTTGTGGMPIGLEAALYGAITSNPDLVALRQGNAASAEAVEVARHFPTTMNPTLWVDVRPLVYERVPGTSLGNGGRIGPRMDQKDALMYFSLRQPIELGYQQRYRYHIAKAAYSQQQWTVVQAELTALVQTYRFFQTAAYRREKLRVATQLAEFNDKLVQTLKQRMEAANVVQPADVALAEVEAEGTRQLVDAARQDYAVALADLHNQLGLPETAGTAEPLGEFVLSGAIPEISDQELIQIALHNRPDLHAARAVVEGARAAVNLAKGDRIPTPIVGPVYERDEQGTQFFGFVYITPIPVLNNGQPLVRQREAELQRAAVAAKQAEQRAIAQIRTAVAKWNGANRLVARTSGLPEKIGEQIRLLERLFEQNQTDLQRLLQARRSLIQLENARLDAMWQATQAQADLLTAVGSPSMIAALRAEARPDPSTSARPMPSNPAPAPPPIPTSTPGGR